MSIALFTSVFLLHIIVFITAFESHFQLVFASPHGALLKGVSQSVNKPNEKKKDIQISERGPPLMDPFWSIHKKPLCPPVH